MRLRVCFSQVFITQIEKQLFYTSLPPAPPYRHPTSRSSTVSDITDPRFLSVLADRGAADRHWGNFPGSGKSADNHTFHGPQREHCPSSGGSAAARGISLPSRPSVHVCFCLLVLCVTCSFFLMPEAFLLRSKPTLTSGRFNLFGIFGF